MPSVWEEEAFLAEDISQGSRGLGIEGQPGPAAPLGSPVCKAGPFYRVPEDFQQQSKRHFPSAIRTLPCTFSTWLSAYLQSLTQPTLIGS